MSRAVRASVVALALSLLSTAGRAQTCLGFPAFAAGPVNLTGSLRVGGRWWGTGAGANVGQRAGPWFGGVGAGTVTFIDPPKETRLQYAVQGGYEKHTRDGPIWCPNVVAQYEQGLQVTDSLGRKWRTSGSVLGAGLGVSGELQSRGANVFSVDPFATVSFISVRTKVAGDSTSSATETGAAFTVGLGFRFHDSIQITPTFSGATLTNADLVFDLRVSIALQGRERK